MNRRADGEFAPGDDALLRDVHEHREAFLQKMDDDFNSGGAVSELFELARLLNKFIDQHQLEGATKNPADVASFQRGTATLRELTAIFGLFVKAARKVCGRR